MWKWIIGGTALAGVGYLAWTHGLREVMRFQGNAPRGTIGNVSDTLRDIGQAEANASRAVKEGAGLWSSISSLFGGSDQNKGTGSSSSLPFTSNLGNSGDPLGLGGVDLKY